MNYFLFCNRIFYLRPIIIFCASINVAGSQQAYKISVFNLPSTVCITQLNKFLCFSLRKLLSKLFQHMLQLLKSNYACILLIKYSKSLEKLLFSINFFVIACHQGYKFWKVFEIERSCFFINLIKKNLFSTNLPNFPVPSGSTSAIYYAISFCVGF